MLFPALFAVVVGAAMIGQWALFLRAGEVPELETEPLRIRFHLAAELATAVALVTSGVALLADAAWARDLFLVAAGMLVYTAIVSSGYFAQQGKWAFVAMFAAVLALAVVSVWWIW